MSIATKVTEIKYASHHLPAIIAGVSIIIMALVAGYAEGFVLQNLLVENDILTTVYNIRNSELLFRSSVFGFLIILICDILATWGLYFYLKQVNERISLLSAWFRLTYTTILGVALLNFIIVLLLLKGVGLPIAPAQINFQIGLFFNAFYDIWALGLVVFGIHLMIVGGLVLKSKFIPKTIGVLLILAAVGYIAINLGGLLLPNYTALLSKIELFFIAPMIFGEVGFAVWLVTKGLKSHAG